MSRRDIERSELLIALLTNPRKGVEFGTHRGLTSNVLLSAFEKLDLITIDNYMVMPWITITDSQSDKQDQLNQATAVLDKFTDRCVLWTLEARAAAILLRGYNADFVYTDLTYRIPWSYKHLPMFMRILKKDGILCGGGWHKHKLKSCLYNLFPDVQGDRTFWWKVA